MGWLWLEAQRHLCNYRVPCNELRMCLGDSRYIKTVPLGLGIVELVFDERVLFKDIDEASAIVRAEVIKSCGLWYVPFADCAIPHWCFRHG
jgi:hypothetical protein